MTYMDRMEKMSLIKRDKLQQLKQWIEQQIIVN